MSASPRYPIATLWCNDARRLSRRDGWRFPRAVRDVLVRETAGLTVLHLFGGRADFGVRLDRDPAVRPDVVGDAWLPPFDVDAFDVVVLDPPYLGINQQMKSSLLRTASTIARRRVFWFHTLWSAGDRYAKPVRAWLVRVGDMSHVRCLQEFRSDFPDKIRPPIYFTRGPAIKYNHWTNGTSLLPFDRPVP